MKKYFTLLIVILIGSSRLLAQQDPGFTLYMLNPIMYNPALAGTANFYQIRTNHRFQWVGMKDAPVTNSITAYGPHSRKDMGFGGTIFNDITGPTSRTGVNAIYGYNISVQRDLRVSFGLNLGLMQYKLDGTKIDTYDELKYHVNDPSLLKVVYSTMLPDASAGVYVYSNKYYGGFSAQHLLDIFSKDAVKDLSSIDVLKTTYYLIGGYMYQINREWYVEPNAILKKVVPASFQLELSTKVIYKSMFWGGLAFRTQDAFSVVVGYTHERKIYFGYAFDLPLNEIRRYTTGSHEIIIGYNFDRIKKVATRKKK